jgi:hypothetical protein
MKPKQLTILSTALLMICLGAVVSVTAQNPTTVCSYFSAKTRFRVNTTCSIISAAFLTARRRSPLLSRSPFVYTTLGLGLSQLSIVL